MTVQTTEFLYEPFAETAEYRTVNGTIVRAWIDSIVEKGPKEVDHLLDIATGVGTMVQIFLENLPKHWKQPTVLCLDQSQEALQQAKTSLESQVKNLELLLSRAEEFQLPANSVDVAMWGNGIHYLTSEAQEKALRAIKKVLKKGGWLCFNSAFYAESRPPETLPFYRAQVKYAVEYLHTLGLGRDRSEARPVASAFLPKVHYENLLHKVGFKIEEVREVAMGVKKTAWEHISSFQQYAAGALHGYRADVAAEAMRESVLPALEEHGSRDEDGNLSISRNWLAISARA
jgi:ubiquinone/menaquinone biosynthesis C-methylase UbiE